MKLLFIIASMVSMSLFAKDFLIIGHRGASGYEPENTLRSFKRAIDMGVKMIELDVFVAKSGELVVMHDDTIDRTTNGKGKIMDLDYATLKKYNAGKGEHIPLLSEVLDLISEHQDKRVNIELKGPKTAKPVATLIKQYIDDKKLTANNIIVSSFDHYAVKEFHSYNPHVKTGVLFEGNPIGYADIAVKANAQYAMMYYENITKEFVEDAHKKNIEVFVYTVNTKPLAQEMQKLGVDGIFTNYPDIMKK